MSTRIERVLLLRSPLAYHEHIGHEDPHPPLELLFLGAALRAAGYQVQILDGQRQWRQDEAWQGMRRCGLSDAELVAEASAFAPQVIALSITWHHQIPIAIYSAQLLKQHLPSAIVVAGGIAPSSSPDVLIDSQAIDYVIAGDGERSVVQFCEALSGSLALEKVSGLIRKRDGVFIRNPKNNFVQLDDISFPAFDLVDLKQYDAGFVHGHHKAYPLAGVLPTRGCPLNCHFCSLPAVSDQMFRLHSVERIVDDILRMRDEFGVREIHFYDDNLINETAYVKALFRRMIDKGTALPWLPEAGFAMWMVDQEVLELAVESGMYRLDLPIEAATDAVKGEIMNKGLYENNQVVDVLRMARRSGVEKINGYVIVGNPGETLEDVKFTLDFFADLDLDFRGVRLAQPFPGTRFYEICEEKGYLHPDFSLERLWFTMSNIVTPEFTSDQLVATVAAYRAAALLRQGRPIERIEKELINKHGSGIADAVTQMIPEIELHYRLRHEQ